MNITTRLAVLSDIPAMYPLWIELTQYHEGHNPYFRLVDNHEELVPQMLEKRFNGIEKFLLAFDDSTLVGMIFIKVEELPPTLPIRKRGYIAETVVTSSHQSKGIGELLVKEAKAYFKQENCEIIELQVSVKNPEGLKFWERMGFFPGTYHMLNVI